MLIFSLNPNEAEYLFCGNEGLELSKQQWTNINENVPEVKFLSFQTSFFYLKGIGDLI